MGRKLTVLGIAALVLLAGTAVASTAFTTATVDRSANINVENDTNGIIGLAANTAVGGMAQSGGTLDLNLDQGTGLNNAANFVFGDNSSSPSGTPAFTLTNNDGASHSITMSYSVTGTDSAGSTDNVVFSVYDGTDTLVGTFSEGGSTTFSLSSSASYYVVIEVDTTNLGASDDLSGTLTVEAN